MFKHRDQVVCDRDRVFGAVDVLDDHRKFITAEARDRVGAAQRPGEQFADGLDQLVAGLVAERVVHQLEIVDIDQHQRDRLAVPVCTDQRVFESVREQQAVRQVGQRIAVGEQLDLAFRHHAGDNRFHAVLEYRPLDGLGDVVDRTDIVGALDRGIVIQAGDHHHRDVGMPLVLDLLAGRKAVDTGHHRIEQHERGAVFFDCLDGFEAVRCLDDVEFLGLQHVPDHQAYRRIIIGQHDDRPFLVFCCIVKE